MKPLLFLCCVLLSFNGFAKDALAEQAQTVLHVRGESELKVEPNQVTIVLGVTTQNKTAKKALSDNSRLMERVIAALAQQKINKKGLSTQRFGVQPVWSSRPRNFSSSEEWKSKITAYRVNNTLKVVTNQLELVGELISTATTAGANQVQSIVFGLANPREYREKAIASAIKNAREDAGFVAKASSLEVVGIKQIHLDNAVASIERAQSASFSRSALSAKADIAPPINAGDITVRASVSVEYFLSQK